MLFGNLRQLLDLHLHLQAEMRKTDKPWEPFAKMVRLSQALCCLTGVRDLECLL